MALALIESRGKGDLDIFLEATRTLHDHGGNPYHELYHEFFHYYYSLSFTFLIYPLTRVPWWLANAIWNLVGVIAAWQLLRLIVRELPLTQLSAKRQRMWYLLVFLLVFSVWQKNLHTAQVTLILAWSIWQSWAWIQDGKWWQGGLLLTFFGVMKVMPFILVPYLFWRGKWKGLLGVALGLVFWLLFPLLAFDSGTYLALVERRWEALDPTTPERILDVTERSMHSILTLVSTLFHAEAKGHYTMQLRRHLVDLPFETVVWFGRLAQTGLVLFTLHFLGRPFFRGSTTRLQQTYALSYIFLVAPLIFPHQQHYAFYMALPAFAWASIFAVGQWKSPAKPRWFGVWCVGLAVVFLCFNLHFLVGQWNGYYNHFKILTWGALVLIALLVAARPRFIAAPPTS